MKYLLIEKGRGFYTLNGNEGQKRSVEEFTKEDLLTLLNIAIDSKDFEMDEYDESILQNAADRIIYKNIYINLDNIIKGRKTFVDEKNNLYRKAIEKYSLQLNSDKNN